ncbi:MAG: ATP-binding cassette domain-containing protein [Anaerolineales bacterium]|nr:ATP-binding cassette domain-containing protein [Anaerolineales bacterium]
MSLLEAENVVKEYRGGIRANDNVSLTVQSGEVFGLLGPNGAGKTTLVQQVNGLLTPTSGRITINGVDVVADPGFARKVSSFQPQTQVPIDGLTPRQAIELVGRLRKGEPKVVKVRTDELIAALELGEWANIRGEALSGGVRRLVAFCMAAVVPGKLIILDEPTNDVDPLRRRLLWGQVRELADQGSAVLLVTHNVLEAERTVDRLAIIDRGKVIGQGTPGSMKDAEMGYLRLELLLEPGAVTPLTPVFFENPVNGGRRLIGKVEETFVDEAVEWASELRIKQVVEEFFIGPATLEDAYLRKIGRADALERNGKDGN